MKLYWNTVSPLLRSLLEELMNCLVFNSFRLAGGTALALQLGHRVSGDISLFTDISYDNLDFETIDFYLKRQYSYVSSILSDITFKGIQSFIGDNENEVVKVDLYCTDPFIQPYQIRESIRMATVEEIIAMKIDTIQRGGCKEDFWDLHELLRTYSLESMIELHKKRYPYSHNKAPILEKFTDFTRADEDFEPICLKGKYWGLIKLDIIQIINGIKRHWLQYL
jgi:hypothetical protein